MIRFIACLRPALCGLFGIGLLIGGCGAKAPSDPAEFARGEGAARSFSLATGWEYAAAPSRTAPVTEGFRPIPDDDLIHLAPLIAGREGWLELRKRFSAPTALLNADLSLLVGRIIWNDVVYLNDRYLGGLEHLNDSGREPNHWNRVRLYRIPRGTLEAGESANTLRIRIYINAEGSLTEIPVLGPTRELIYKARMDSFFRVEIHVIVAAVLLVFAVYHLFIFFKRRSDLENLYYALFLIGFALYEMNFFSHLIAPFDDLPYLYQQLWIWLVMHLTVYSGVLFSLKIVREKPGPILHIVLAALLLGPALTLPLYEDYATFYQYRSYYMGSVIAFMGTAIFLSIRGMVRKIPEARSLALGLALLFLPILHDVAAEILKLDVEVFLTAYGFPLFLGSMAFALANKFVNLHNQVEDLNAGLERRVDERTRELNESLTHTQQLKHIQDGDYFLTSLLLNPLGVNYARSETFDVTFFVRQKKRFQFRKYERDLGGDLCAAHTIHLRGQAHTVFLNADAMGKSMQGAGGALVLGSVFQSIIERTHINPLEQKQSAEAWLKSAFVELHKVFVSFDGSMLVSMVMGLAEDRTGTVYYVNAEHPAPILYRAGRAAFLKSDVLYRKLGTTGVESMVSIQVYRMLPGDTLVFGSDGKDDIRFSAEAGEVNEDETRILASIERFAADPERIYEAIAAEGEIIDDFSVLRLVYRPEEVGVASGDATESGVANKSASSGADAGLAPGLLDARARIRAGEYVRAVADLQKLRDAIGASPVELLRLLIHCLVESKRYAEAAVEVRGYLEQAPEDNEMLYAASVIHRRAGESKTAVELGERLRLRVREDTRNLVHLARLHRSVGDVARARYLLEETLRIDANHARARELLAECTK
ncbi:MAG: 7TM diverse intracellular signaling domain-containing protein [Leptospirales bacterium]|jgi:Flp pilus assembly protein TadD